MDKPRTDKGTTVYTPWDLHTDITEIATAESRNKVGTIRMLTRLYRNMTPAERAEIMARQQYTTAARQ